MAEAGAEISPDKKRTKERGIDDYKRKIWKLKKELEEQKEEAKLCLQHELTELRANLTAEKEQAVDGLKLEMMRDLMGMKSQNEEKRAEIERQCEKKDKEIHTLKQQASGHKQELRTVRDAIESANQETVAKLHRELKQLKHSNQELQIKYQNKQKDYKDKISELKTVQEEAEVERQKLLNEALTNKLSKLKRDQDSNGQRGDREAERELRHKVIDLTTTIKRLEKRSQALKEENANLKKTEASCRDVEEQGAKLKRKNAELAAALKAAESKNKQLHSDNRKSLDTTESNQALEHMKKVFARQRAKDFAEHSKALLSKDKEIDRLQRKSLSLTDGLCNQTRSLALDHLEMSTVLKQTTKEKLVLEMRANNMTSEDSDARAQLFNLQADFDNVQDKYDALQEETDRMRKELEKLRELVTSHQQELSVIQAENTTLTSQLQRSEKKTTELTLTNKTLMKSNLEWKDVEKTLTEEIGAAQKSVEDMTVEKTAHAADILQVKSECDTWREKHDKKTEEVDQLKHQLGESMQELKQLREDSFSISSQMTNLLENNNLLQSEMNQLKTQATELMDATTEQKAENAQLKLENEELKEESKEYLNVQSENDDLMGKLEHVKLENLTLNEQMREQAEAAEKDQQRSLQAQSQEHNKLVTGLKEELNQSVQAVQELTGVQQRQTAELNESLNQQKEAAVEELQQLEQQFILEKARVDSEYKDVMTRTNDEHTQLVDSLRDELNDSRMRIIELEDLHSSQLNQQCEATDKLTSSIKNELNAAKTRFREAEDSLDHQNQRNNDLESLVADLTHELEEGKETINEYELTIESLREEIKRLHEKQQELDRKFSEKRSENSTLAVQVTELKQRVKGLQKNTPNSSKLAELEQEIENQKEALSAARKARDSLENSAKRKLLSLKKQLTASFETKMEAVEKDLNETREMNGSLQSRLADVESELEDYQAKQISVYAGDNCYHLYVARRAYNPMMIPENSNESLPSPTKSVMDPDDGHDSAMSTERAQEVCLNAGDYVFISGEITEEGYYEGRLLDGKSGLVPSNVLEPLYEFDIYGFVLASEKDDADSSRPVDISSDFSSTMFNDSSNFLPSSPRVPAPHPMKPTLERQFANSILVGWDAPDTNEEIFQYKVYVNGKVKASVTGETRTKVLVDGIKIRVPHRVSVTATSSLGESDHRHCTMVIGEPVKNPSDLCVTAISSEEVTISFLPHNTNHQHLIVINGSEVRNLHPGIFKVDVSGMVPKTDYVVTVATSIKPGPLELTQSRDMNTIPLSITTKFTMPVAIANGLEDKSSFLEGIEKILKAFGDDEPIEDNQAMAPELIGADFLEEYDSTIPEVKHNQTIPSQMSHSTPNMHPRHKSLKESLEDNISPIVLEAEVTPTAADRSEHTTIGASEATPTNNLGTNGNNSPSMYCDPPTSASSSKPISLSEDHQSSRSDRSPEPRNSSMQNKKKTIQKLLKSLANSDKKASRITQQMTEANGLDTPTSSRDSPSRRRGQTKRQRIRSGTTPTRESFDSESDGFTSSPPQPAGVTSPPVLGLGADEFSEDELRPRPFVALFDYNPSEMSPNTDSAAELKFHTNDVIYVFGGVDEDGFYHGELQGVRGYVPSNMVQEAAVTSPVTLTAGILACDGILRMVALYDYDPHALSPNADVEQELRFRRGDIISISGKLDEDGFYTGELDGKRGLVPSNYLANLQE